MVSAIKSACSTYFTVYAHWSVAKVFLGCVQQHKSQSLTTVLLQKVQCAMIVTSEHARARIPQSSSLKNLIKTNGDLGIQLRRDLPEFAVLELSQDTPEVCMAEESEL